MNQFPEFLQQADSIIANKGNIPIFNLTLNEYVTVTRATAFRQSSDYLAEPEVKYFSRQDIMQLCRISYPTLLNHEKRGLLGSTLSAGHKRLYTQEDIDNYLQKVKRVPSCKI